MSLTLLLAACASPARVNLSPEQRSSIKELNAHVIVVQDEVIAAVQPSQVSLTTGGGLIGAMIDSSVTNSRVKESQKIMGPFYAEIENVDYRTIFNDTIREELKSYPIAVSKVMTSPQSLNQSELRNATKTLAQDEALLIIAPSYTLTMDFRSFDATAIVSMWTKSGELKPVYRGVLHYQSPAFGPGGKDSIALWGADGAKQFQGTMHESVAEIMKMIRMDVNFTAPQEKSGESSLFAFNTGAGNGTIKGRLLSENAGRIIVIGDNGTLYSLPKAQASTAMAQH